MNKNKDENARKLYDCFCELEARADHEDAEASRELRMILDELGADIYSRLAELREQCVPRNRVIFADIISNGAEQSAIEKLGRLLLPTPPAAVKSEDRQIR